ncbi:MAG: hypothetical protein AAFZ80_03840 [Cyanobacteria bacterium P01_A01_bin.105]
MQAIQGIQAFEACWTALKQIYPTSQAENTLLIQSMGRYVDAYSTQDEIRAGLPQPLQPLFDRLIDAYTNGYNPTQLSPEALTQPVLVSSSTGPGPQRLTAATLAVAELRHQSPTATVVSEADTFVLDASIVLDAAAMREATAAIDAAMALDAV